MAWQINKKEVLFLITITIYLPVLFIDYTALPTTPFFEQAMTYVRYLCYLLAVIKILIDWYNTKSIWRIGIVLILVGLTVLNLRGNTYFYYLLMIIAAKDVNLHKIIRQACYVLGIGLATIIFAPQLGLIENFLYIQSERYRYSLGFTYTTFAPIFFFFFMMCYIYLRKEKMRIYEFAILEAINYWLFTMTGTRVSFYLSTIMLAYVFVMRFYWQNHKERIHKNRWLLFAPVACCIGAILMQIFYNPENSVWVTLDSILNGRLRLGWEGLHTYGVTWFGQEIQWIGHSKMHVETNYNYVDCSYMQLLLECGIIFLIIVIVAYTFMMYTAIKTKDFYLQTILLVIVAFSITEPRLMNLAFNPFPLLAAAAWSTKDLAALNRKEPSLVPRFKMRTVQIRFKSRI